MSDFNVKLVIFSHANIALRKGKKTNDGVRKKELSRSPSCGSGETPFAPAIFSVKI
jgi:hypothetical protein